MGLLGWVEDRAKDVGHAIEHGIDTAAHAVVRALELNFSDGSRPSGEDPAKIYHYFHSGEDTGSYQNAQQAARTLSSSMSHHADDLTSATRALSSGWTGRAAEAAQTALAPLRTRFDGLSTHAQGGSQQVAAQVSTFGDTKNKVVQLPAEPPSGGGLEALASPAAMLHAVTADAAVAAYQHGTQTNQAAYSGYSGATTPQASGFSRVPGRQTGPGPDTSVDRGNVSPGHGGGGSYHTYSAGGGDGGSGTDRGQRGGAAAPGHSDATGGHGGGGASATHRPGGGSARPLRPGTGTAGHGYGSGQNTSTAGLTPAGGTGAPPGQTSNVSPGGSLAAGSAVGSGNTGGGSPELAPLGGYAGSGGYSGAGGEPVRGGLPGSGRAGGGVGGASDPGEGVGGRTGATPGASAAAEQAAAKGAAGAAGGRGVTGGMPMGGQGGRRDEDQEHRTAGFLVHEEHGNELVGDIEPVPPPVIGE
jgi:hypothetical protein